MSLALIAAATLTAYRLWFVPALAQIEHDRQTLEQLVARVGRRASPAMPATPPPAAVACAQPSEAQPKAPALPRRPTRIIDRVQRAEHPALDSACADPRDPLCGALDL